MQSTLTCFLSYLLKRLFSLSLLILFLASSAKGQPLPKSLTLVELKTALQKEMDRQHIAGMSVTLVTKDSILWCEGLGLADVERKTPVTNLHLFRMGSTTKLFTALGILTLINGGKLSVNTPLHKIAPEVPFQNSWEDTYPITIQHLLEHSTGFSDKSPIEEFNYADTYVSNLQSLHIFEKYMVSKWKPGQRHSYSNVNYAILAYLIEKLSGQAFNEYMRQHVFQSLNMLNTNVHLRSDNTNTYAKGYIWQNEKFRQIPSLPQYNPGNGSLHTNAIDLSHALQAYLNDWQTPQGQFLSKAILADSETPHSYLSAQADLHNTYAYGNDLLAELPDGFQFRGHIGIIGPFSSTFAYNRELGIGYAYAVNSPCNAFPLDSIIRHYLTQHVPKPQPVSHPLDKESIEPYLGYYRFDSPNDLRMGFLESLQFTFVLSQKGEELEAKRLLGGGTSWTSVSEKIFRDSHTLIPRIALVRNSENEPVVMQSGLYFKKINAIEAWLPIVVLLLCVCLLFISVLYGIVVVIWFVIQRIRKQSPSFIIILLQILPALAAVSLGMALIYFSSIISYLYEGISVTPVVTKSTIALYGFGLFTATMIVLLVIRFRSLNTFLKTYLSLTTLAGSYVLILLLIHHWF
ncbi:serine hydrolase domain-containing protein [Cytophagaceae bacterium DM2B3-1]|uniref:Serine hydrolase domain-containing protein n=1 Tax=Xanthocytophaga flava TaxID=3048013 RepID=A0ABT7CQL8_9BACT|nr:serine hydrolase domain-containing protein [Xanthocytophaga flavus]MDJ1495247.1 serine hydrolase domain-containing protein [Xanthocytophaga flavus]